ncbi:YaaC family protein [Bacillus sp. A116_S68]|nr:YaaC family protein [Bacillus sp. A116_S68]
MVKQPPFTTLFQSADFAKNYLTNHYKAYFTHPEEKAYKCCYSFVYYIDLGSHYFDQGKRAPLSIKPVLLFYGLSNWLKAALLTIDPDYPATTQVLAHGLSARKRKKQGYEFLSDEVRYQKEGLFPYLSSKLFNIKQVTGEKIKMRHLLFNIPEMQTILFSLFNETGLVPLNVMTDPDNYLLKKACLNFKDHEFQRWLRLVNDLSDPNIIVQNKEKSIHFEIRPETMSQLCLIRASMSGIVYIPRYPEEIPRTPELLVHYMLLYQLSMICRYETEWWGDLIYSFSSNDLPVITKWLEVSQSKSPWLINQFFFPKKE